MRNISFDNPWWLLLALPLLLALTIPYFISVSKDNKSKGWITSLIIHIVIALSLTLSAAGLVHTTVMTRTKVYVVADVSYSANRNMDVIDKHIANIADTLPSNSRLGIVCFGKDSAILTSSGTKIKSVKEAKVDTSGTNIVGALDYTSTLFSEGELKRIILITDGFDTTSDNNGLVSAVERLEAKNIKLDAIYINSNLQEGDEEIQISDVEYTKATYLNHKTTAKILLESSMANDVLLDLYVKTDADSEYFKIDTTVTNVDVGVNIATFTLPTNAAGVFDYKIELSATHDTSTLNNVYHFTQTVVEQRKVLLVTELQSDVTALSNLYSETAAIEPYVVSDSQKNIPYTVEALSQYDEIVVSNVDIRKINNINAFVDSVDVVVSQYGKSLITLGDLSMQNKDDEIFTKLEELLPVSFGNANKDAKLYTIVLDISRSMNDTSQLIIAKDASIKLLSLLEDDDYVAYVTLAGEARVEQTPTRLGDCREELYKKIQNASPTQGTFVGEALKLAYEHIKDLQFEEKQVMLISDGLTFTYEPEDAVFVARNMHADGITVSTVNVISRETEAERLLSGIAQMGGGTYYYLDRAENVADLVFATIADDLTESVVEKKSNVTIANLRDDTVEGFVALPDVYGYVNSKAKLDATMVVSVDYQKNADTVMQVPLYSYREHGNGRVATFTSSLSGNWLKDWEDDTKALFFDNVLTTNTPTEHINYPYALTLEYGGGVSSVEIAPSYLNPQAKATIKITSPNGMVSEEQLTFDLNRYFTTFETPITGKYHIEIVYSYGNHSFASSTYFTVPYPPEYNAFAVYDVASIYEFMRNAGTISTDGKLNLENDKNDVATYELSFRIPLLILAVVLFIVDIFIRKTRWKDIQAWLEKIKKKGGAKK